MVFPWEPIQGVVYGIRLDINGFHMPLKARAYRKKGMMLLPRVNLPAIQFVRGVCGTNTRSSLVQVSDQRGTCLL